ncbi:MAG: response regulator [Bacteriovorax sp.]|jgi:two-component system chemotaxis response regulator CheY
MALELPDHLREITFLIVDDMSFYRSLVEQTLGNLGHVGKIYSAKDLKEAINIVNEVYKTGGRIDFVIADYHLSDSTGVELAKKMRAQKVLKNIPIVIFSTDDNSNNIIEAIDAGVDNFFFKPIKDEILLEKINFCWNKRNNPK